MADMGGLIYAEYLRWLSRADSDIASELKEMADDPKQIEDAFYQELTFGTGGLRGEIGAGTNRMNIHTVAKASQGLANYINRHYPAEKRKIAVGFDSRIKSELFAKTAAAVFAANGIQAFIYRQLMPTPCLSFAVRALRCAAGVMITASHNPALHNGYKVYGADGCQITLCAAEEIYGEIEKIDIFDDVQREDFATALGAGQISYITDDVYDSFVEAVKQQSMLFAGEEIDRNVSIVYSPLNGTGLEPVMRVLRETGFTNITVVKEQEQPDGRFPTCPYPNPETPQAMALGLAYVKRQNADLLLATDPDCDRVGVAAKGRDGEYTLLTGNEVGLLLLDYICARRQKLGKMPPSPVMIKTIVTTDLAEKVAAHYGVKTINVLTGFKFIGEQIGYLEAQGRLDDFIFGFEESCGYLSGTYVRDKDAVSASFLLCEMCAVYKTQAISLLDKLNELYRQYGYCLNTLHSYTFSGASGAEKMKRVMTKFRSGVAVLGGIRVSRCLDYALGIDGLPKSDVLKYILDSGVSVVVRPSGTEPKLKIYISVVAEDHAMAEKIGRDIVADIERYLE